MLESSGHKVIRPKYELRKKVLLISDKFILIFLKKNKIIALMNQVECPKALIYFEDEGTVDFLTDFLTTLGLCVVSKNVNPCRLKEEEIKQEITHVHPRYIFWDIAYPYDRGWLFFKKIKEATTDQDIKFIPITNEFVSLELREGLPEVIEAPFDLDKIAKVIRKDGQIVREKEY